MKIITLFRDLKAEYGRVKDKANSDVREWVLQLLESDKISAFVATKYTDNVTVTFRISSLYGNPHVGRVVLARDHFLLACLLFKQ